MVFASILLFGDVNKNQIFQRIFMMTLLCVIYSKPFQRNITEPSTDLKTENALFDVERQRIIAELKLKLITRLKLDYIPTADQTFNWDSVPEEMKDVFNDELENESSETDNSDGKIETFISPLRKGDHCRNNQSINRECFNLTLPNLDNDEIISVKLITQFLSSISSQTVKLNISINQLSMEYDLSTTNELNGNIEIDIFNIFKDVLTNEISNNNINGGNKTALFLNIDGYQNNLQISQIIDVAKIVLEVQFRSSITKRSKRSTNICEPNQYFCCRQSMRVNIRELELINYIVAPRSFIMNYCKGDCNNFVQHSSNHAKAINFVRGQEANELRETRPCCVPYTFSSQKIMYYSKEKTLDAAIFNDLSAASCGCL